MSIRALCPFWNRVVCCHCCSVVGVPYEFWVLTCYHVYDSMGCLSNDNWKLHSPGTSWGGWCCPEVLPGAHPRQRQCWAGGDATRGGWLLGYTINPPPTPGWGCQSQGNSRRGSGAPGQHRPPAVWPSHMLPPKTSHYRRGNRSWLEASFRSVIAQGLPRGH